MKIMNVELIPEALFLISVNSLAMNHLMLKTLTLFKKQE